MECQIISPYYSKKLQIKEILVDTGQGKLSIFPNHTDFIATIKQNDEIIIKTNKETHKYRVNQGLVKIQSNKCLIIIDIDK